MYKNILVLDDGTEISAGTVGHNAILSLTATETVSGTTDLCPGAACSNKLEITLWVEPGSNLLITSGTRLVHYREDESGTRTRCGTYWAVKPTRQTRNTYKIYAYDAVSRLDGIQSTWLRSIQGQFPMTLWAFAQLVARRCGVEIANDTLPRNGDYQVQAFYADDLTGRQLLSWVAQASCTFLRSMPDGKIGFDWYTEHVTPGIGPTAGQEQLGYYSGGLSYEDYTTAPIVKVQIRQTDDDVGVIYPADETGANALVIQGNLLLTTQTADALRPVAQAIYDTMHGVSYTPMRVDIPYTADAPAPGQIITLEDAYGRRMQTYVMSRTISGQRVTLESTGNARRDSTAAVNEQKYTNLTGKMLEISAGVEGLNVKASELSGNYSALSQTVEGFKTEVQETVSSQNERISTAESNYSSLSQTVSGLSSTVSSVKTTANNAASKADSAAAKADSALSDAKNYTDGQLTEYSTTEETKSLIVQSADQITSEVSKTYATTASVEKSLDTLQAAATQAQQTADKANTDAAAAQAAADKAAADAAAAAAEADKAKQAASDAEANAAADAQEKADAAQAAAEKAAAADAQAKAAAAEAAAKKAAAEDATAKANAAQEAANQYTDTKLTKYSTTTQMNSAIDQKASEITQTVSKTYRTEAQVQSAIDGSLTDYSTTAEMNSAIEQRAGSLKLSVERSGYFSVFEGTSWTNYTAGTFGNKITVNGVSGTAARLSTTDPDTLTYARGNTLHGSLSYRILTAIKGTSRSASFRFFLGVKYTDDTYTIHDIIYDQGNKTIAAAGSKTTVSLDVSVSDKKILLIYLEVSASRCSGVIEVGEVWANVAELNGKASTLTLTADGTKISSANIVMKGAVSFEDLSGAGRTTINGANVTTGIIRNAAGTTEYNLDNGTIRMGGSSGNRVYIDSDKIEWYGGNASGGGTGAGIIQNGLTTGTSGDTCVIGADTRYQKYGWYHDGNFQGITVEQVDNEVMVSGKLSVSQSVSCRTLKAWDAKERVVRTPLGNLQMNAMESPEPLFWDVGSGVCDSTGVCWIALRPEYAETISRRTALRWVVTPTGGAGNLWVEKLDSGALVHGGAGQRFDWACAGVQRGFEGCYAEGDPGRYPVPENPGDWLLTAAMDDAAVDLPLTI